MLASVPGVVEDAGAWCAVVIAFGGATALIMRMIRGSLRELDERIDRHIEPLQATLHGFDSRLARVEAEMTPNGGSSLRDALDRIEAKVTEGKP